MVKWALKDAGKGPGTLKPMAIIDEISSKGRIFHPGTRRQK